MEIKELIAKNLPAIKKMLFGEEIKMEANEAKLSDGITIVKWDGELIVGTPIMVVSEAGLTPAPDGSHELEDGRKIEVMDGLVTAIETPKEQEQEEEVIEVETQKVDFAKEIEALKADFESKITAQKESFAAVELSQKQTIASLQESFKLMFEVVEALAGEPQKVEEVKPDSKTIKKENFFNKLEEISKNLEIKK